jgi:hypothetical protein
VTARSKHRDEHGIWGGLTEDERTAAADSRKEAA